MERQWGRAMLAVFENDRRPEAGVAGAQGGSERGKVRGRRSDGTGDDRLSCKFDFKYHARWNPKRVPREGGM